MDIDEARPSPRSMPLLLASSLLCISDMHPDDSRPESYASLILGTLTDTRVRGYSIDLSVQRRKVDGNPRN